MALGPILIFDKSSLESLNLDEAVMLDNFFLSNITPLFFVECLADLEKEITRSKSTPEQLVGALATRTPDAQSYPNVHHTSILRAELTGQFDLEKSRGRIMLARGKHVQLEGKNGVIFERSAESEAVSRWSKREFLDLERHLAKKWRQSITQIDLERLSQRMGNLLGPWRNPISLSDARSMAEIIVDNIDPERLLRFGLESVGAPADAVEFQIQEWINQRRPALRKQWPYFVFLLTINTFFCLALRGHLLKKLKPSHMVDLAYLYYLPFCSVFTSKDNFHADVVPLFLAPDQSFVNGTDLKQGLMELVTHYEALPEDVRKQGLAHFAAYPPDDKKYLVTQLWDKRGPEWREVRDAKQVPRDAEEEKRIVAEINRLTESPELKPSEEVDTDNVAYATVKRTIYPVKGRWFRYSQEQIKSIEDTET